MRPDEVAKIEKRARLEGVERMLVIFDRALKRTKGIGPKRTEAIEEAIAEELRDLGKEELRKRAEFLRALTPGDRSGGAWEAIDRIKK